MKGPERQGEEGEGGGCAHFAEEVLHIAGFGRTSKALSFGRQCFQVLRH